MRRPKKSNVILEAHCPVCDKTVRVDVDDCSFDYEYGSERGTHHEYAFSCRECGESIPKSEIEEYEYEP